MVIPLSTLYFRWLFPKLWMVILNGGFPGHPPTSGQAKMKVEKKMMTMLRDDDDDR